MPENTRKILCLMSDLFFSVKINDAAKKLRMTVEFVKEKEVALERIKSKPPLIILDLNCEAADPLGLIATFKQDPETKDITTIAFVSHVQTELKQKALESGCDVVVARSSFAQNLPAILERYATPAQVPEAD
jgi:CheY-like chemotaxis protein